MSAETLALVLQERVLGERVRMHEHIARLRAMVYSLELAVDMTDVPISDVAQAVADSSSRMTACAARLDAYMIGRLDANRECPP